MSTATMQVSQWSPKYLVNNAEMDRQHKILFELAAHLHEAMLLGKGRESLGAIMKQVRTHASDHRAFEERLMEDAHYPDARAHIQQHEELERKSLSLFERVEHGETTITIELALFISSWIGQHIMTTDRRLAEYLSAR